jgi:hypothetical protein
MKSRDHHWIGCEKSTCRVLISSSELGFRYLFWSSTGFRFKLEFIGRARESARVRGPHGVRVRSVWDRTGPLWFSVGAFFCWDF